MRRPLVLLPAVVLASLLLAAPFLVEIGIRGVLSKILIAALFATAYSLMSGVAGLLSFGHAAFFGLGAIATMHLMLAAEKGGAFIPAPLVPLAGALAGGLCAAVAGAISSRRTGSYFALITLAFAELVHGIAIQWQGVFGGEAGLTSMRMPWLGVQFSSATQVYYAVLIWVALGVLACWLFKRTGFGQLAMGIRENEERVSFLGFNTYCSKIVVFVVSGAVSGLAGGLLAFSNESATYALFSPLVSLEVVFQTFIGGTALFLGPAVAAAALTLLPYALSEYTRLWPLYQGVLFMALMYAAPGGVSSLFGRNGALRNVAAAQIAPALPIVVACAAVACGFVVAAEITHALVESGGRAASRSAGWLLLAEPIPGRTGLKLAIVWGIFLALCGACGWGCRLARGRSAIRTHVGEPVAMSTTRTAQ